MDCWLCFVCMSGGIKLTETPEERTVSWARNNNWLGVSKLLLSSLPLQSAVGSLRATLVPGTGQALKSIIIYGVINHWVILPSVLSKIVKDFQSLILGVCLVLCPLGRFFTGNGPALDSSFNQEHLAWGHSQSRKKARGREMSLSRIHKVTESQT